jgi:putative transposase
MGRKGHGPQLIAEVLRKSAEGMPTAEISRVYGITERTFYRWKLRHSGASPEESRVLKQIDAENRRLRALVAELILENRTLKEKLPLNRTTGKPRRPSGTRIQ